MDSQVISTKLQTAETAMAHLKRCFCTLPLRNNEVNKYENKSIKIQSAPPKYNHSSTGNFLKKCVCILKLNKVGKQQHQPSTPIVKYEIKGTSTHKRRVPQHFIKKLLRILEPYEYEPNISVPGECDPYECLKLIQQRQVRDFGTDYKRYVKDSATDSIKQPRTRSTKAQYNQKWTLNSRGTSVASKRTRGSRETDTDTDKQVMRIGSNFSFNIEFFKDHVAANTERKDNEEFKAENVPIIKTSPLQRPEDKLRIKSRVSISTKKRLHDKKFQYSSTKSQFINLAVNIKIVKIKGNEKDSKSYLNKNVTVGGGNVQNYNSYSNDIELKNHVSEDGNLLKRFFCTLHFHGPARQKMKRIKVHRPGNNVRYPQAVGRVAVEPFPNTIMKTNVKKKEKARSTSIPSELLTKIDKKCLQNVAFPSLQCNPSNCPGYQKRFFSRKSEINMQIVLPYMRSKYNKKKKSRTYLSDKNKLKKKHVPSQLKEEDVHKSNEISMLSNGNRRLTAKKSKKSIPTKSPKTKSNIKDSFFCRWIQFFSGRSETRSEVFDKQNYINDRPTKFRTKSQLAKIDLVIPPKKAKSYGENCPFISPGNNETGKRYSKLQSGRDGVNIIIKAQTKPKNINNTISKSQESRKFNSKHPQMRVTFVDKSDYSKHKILKRKINKYLHSKSSERSPLCYSCSVNDYPLKFINSKRDQKTSGAFNLLCKGLKTRKKAIYNSESANDCQYCKCCKRKINTNVISKGGGDRRSTVSSQYKVDTDTCLCGKEFININEKKYSVREKLRADKFNEKYFIKENKCCNKITHLLGIQLNSVDHANINKDEVTRKINRLSNNNKQIADTKSNKFRRKHNKLRICCKCRRKREKREMELSIGAKDANNVAARGGDKILDIFGKLFSVKKKYPIQPPAKCGAESKRQIKRKLDQVKVKFGETCICGSNISISESQRLKKEWIANKAQSAINKKEMKEVQRRMKTQEEKDEIRRLKRIKRNKELEQRGKKRKDASNIKLAVDSLVDIGKLGVSTLTGALCYSTRTFADPKVARERLYKGYRKKEPKSWMKGSHKRYKESDAASISRRRRMRFMFMKHAKSLRQKLEENRATHFLLHGTGENAKTRQLKRKPVRRVREPLDFQCSLYMTTLRNKPYLSVYNRCPQFYSHFITKLNIWRQLTDTMLFLLAVLVWSPCILCTGGCRALMCCFFYTG